MTVIKMPLTRYRWLLLIACLGALAIGWWQLSARPSGRFTREQYDRIRLGMTPAEVASCIGSSSSKGELITRLVSRSDWEAAAFEAQESFSEVDDIEAWVDESVFVGVCYSHGKAVRKDMEIHLSPLKVKAREWLTWLRGLVGW